METCQGGYVVNDTPNWSGYSRRHDWTTYSPSSHRVDDRTTIGSATLEELLSKLQEPAFCAELTGLRQGREWLTFSKSPTLEKLQAALKASSDPRKAVEDRLNQLFVGIKPDEEFEHTEIVMALLFAIHEAKADFFVEIATVLANSRAAEIGRLSRYARRLLAS